MPITLPPNKMDEFFLFLKDTPKFQHTCQEAFDFFNAAPSSPHPEQFIKKSRDHRLPPHDPSPSFIKKDGRMYAISRKILGKGSYARVKLLIEIRREEKGCFIPGDISVIKIEENNNEKQQFEYALNSQLKIAIGKKEERESIKPPKKYYTQLKFLGDSFTEYLKIERPLEERIDLAIKLCEAVDDFNTSGYVHNDIKLENVTRDDKGNVHLIDLGYACPIGEKISIRGTPTQLLGAENYRSHDRPSTICVQRAWGLLNSTEVDALALKRTLFGLTSKESKRPKLLLLSEITMLSKKMQEILDTSDTLNCIQRREDTPLTIAAALVLQWYLLKEESEFLEMHLQLLWAFPLAELKHIISIHHGTHEKAEKTKAIKEYLVSIPPIVRLEYSCKQLIKEIGAKYQIGSSDTLMQTYLQEKRLQLNHCTDNIEQLKQCQQELQSTLNDLTNSIELNLLIEDMLAYRLSGYYQVETENIIYDYFSHIPIHQRHAHWLYLEEMASKSQNQDLIPYIIKTKHALAPSPFTDRKRRAILQQLPLLFFCVRTLTEIQTQFQVSPDDRGLEPFISHTNKEIANLITHPDIQKLEKLANSLLSYLNRTNIFNQAKNILSGLNKERADFLELAIRKKTLHQRQSVDFLWYMQKYQDCYTLLDKLIELSSEIQDEVLNDNLKNMNTELNSQLLSPEEQSLFMENLRALTCYQECVVILNKIEKKHKMDIHSLNAKKECLKTLHFKEEELKAFKKELHDLLNTSVSSSEVQEDNRENNEYPFNALTP